MSSLGVKLRRIDGILFLAPAILAILGLLAVWTVDLAQDPDALFNFKKHLIFTLAGFGLALLFTFVDYRALRALTRVLYFVGLALLLAVLFLALPCAGPRAGLLWVVLLFNRWS